MNDELIQLRISQLHASGEEIPHSPYLCVLHKPLWFRLPGRIVGQASDQHPPHELTHVYRIIRTAIQNF